METTKETTDKMLTEWSNCTAIDNIIADRLENWELFYDTKPTEEQVQEDVYHDYDSITCAYEQFIEDLTYNILQERNPNGFWYVKVRNFGWRCVDGYSFLQIKTGTELVQKVLPNCDCSFKIFADGDKNLKIQNFHHDSPVGNEWYYLQVITEKQFDEESLE